MKPDNNHIIETNLIDIEAKLLGFDKKIQECINIKSKNFISQPIIENARRRSENLIIESINNRRQHLITTLRNTLDQNLKTLNPNKLMVLKLKTAEILYRLTSCLIGNLYYNNDFPTIRRKLVYLSFLNSVKEFMQHEYQGDRFGNVIR